MDDQDGTVAARSRALFAQLRSRREARAAEAAAKDEAEDAAAAGEEAVLYDYAVDDDLVPAGDTTSDGNGLESRGDTPEGSAESDSSETDLGVTAAITGGPPAVPDAGVSGLAGASRAAESIPGEDAAANPRESIVAADVATEPDPTAAVVATRAADVAATPDPGGAVAAASGETEPADLGGSTNPPPASGAPVVVHEEDAALAVGARHALSSTAPSTAADVVGSVNGTAEEVSAPGRHPAADLPLPRIVAIANQKGGVGKTTTAVNLGAALAELGFRTLIVDLDPQGNATTGLGVNARNLEHAIYDVLMHELPIDECIEPTSVRNLFVAPATIDLAGAEIELVPAFSRELRLRRALAEVTGEYDFTIIDCPPSLGLLTVNGLAAAGEVIVPIQCEYYALEGLSQLLRNVNLVQSNLNPALDVSAIILTMYDARTKLADQVAAEVRQHFGARVCRNVVPRTVRLSEAPSFGQPIIVFDPSSRGALAYRELAKEVSGGAPQRTG